MFNKLRFEPLLLNAKPLVFQQILSVFEKLCQMRFGFLIAGQPFVFMGNLPSQHFGAFCFYVSDNIKPFQAFANPMALSCDLSQNHWHYHQLLFCFCTNAHLLSDLVRSTFYGTSKVFLWCNIVFVVFDVVFI